MNFQLQSLARNSFSGLFDASTNAASLALGEIRVHSRPFAVLIIIFIHSLTSALAADTCELRITLRETATGDSLPGHLRARDASGNILAIPGALNRLSGLPARQQALGWHTLPPGATLTLPQSPLSFEAFHGLETEIARATLDLTGKATATLEIPLTRFYNAREKNLLTGNTHLHLRNMTREEADRYLRTLPAADGLDLVFLSYLERALVDRTYTSNEYTIGDLESLSTGGVLFGNGEEHRHNFGGGGEGYGHVMLLDIAELIRPVSIGPGIARTASDTPALRPGIDTARARGGTVVWCHNGFGFEDLPSWLDGRIHAQNIFDGGNQGAYADTFYRYLDIGLRVPFSTGTDWFLYDFSRVYLPLDREPTIDTWLAALAAGKGTITNGPLLEFEVERESPGGEIHLDGPSVLAIHASAIGRADFTELQVVVNGEVIRSVPSRTVRGHFKAEFALEISVNESSWLAARIESETKNTLDRQLFAHTSPVYATLEREPRFVPAAAQSLVDEMRESIKTITEKAVFTTDKERQSILTPYQTAIRHLESRIQTEN